MKVLTIFAVATVVMGLLSCSSKRPANIGIRDGKLAPCPESPNCVSSMAGDEAHFIEPLSYTGSAEEARERLIETVKSMKRTKIVAEDENYIHAEFTSAIFRFVDDVEFLFDRDANRIHVRSASRVGHSDLGVNRKRVEEIRNKFSGD